MVLQLLLGAAHPDPFRALKCHRKSDRSLCLEKDYARSLVLPLVKTEIDPRRQVVGQPIL